MGTREHDVLLWVARMLRIGATVLRPEDPDRARLAELAEEFEELADERKGD